MALELRQQLKLTQQLIMTPQLQMAIKLLQLSRLELLETVNQELEENPALEEVQESLGKQVPFPPRLGAPEEYADTVAFIYGNTMVNGETIRVDGVSVALMVGVGATMFFLLGLRSDTEVANDALEVVTEPWWVFLLAGSIAICAMILPGVSGSFLLVMLGMYTEVLGAVNDRDITSLAAFGIGCVIGLALFSTGLNWALEHHHDLVMAAMIGLMLGSLRVLWAWPGGTATTELGRPSGDVLVPTLLAVLGAAVVIGVVLVAMLGIGVAEHTGFINSAIRSMFSVGNTL